MRVLILDDDDVFLFFLQDCLEEQGIEVSLAKSVAEAIETISEEYLKRGYFDLIITHLISPNTGDLELMMYLRSHHVDIPTIALLDEKKKCSADLLSYVDAVASRIMHKPIQQEDLIANANALVARAHTDKINVS